MSVEITGTSIVLGVNTTIVGVAVWRGFIMSMRLQERLSKQDQMAKDVSEIKDHLQTLNGRTARAENAITAIQSRHEAEDRFERGPGSD